MDKDEKIKIIEDMQAVVEQMRLDDLEEDPSLIDETFEFNTGNTDYATIVFYWLKQALR